MIDTTQPPIAITCGDPSGVGPEVVAMWARRNPSIAARCAFIGPRRWCGELPGLGVPVGDFEAVPGRPCVEGAALAFAALEEAAKGCAEFKRLYGQTVTACTTWASDAKRYPVIRWPTRIRKDPGGYTPNSPWP